MEYPGTKLSRRLRLLFLAASVMAFSLISPALILYAAGYRYDWQNGLLKKTGAISIDIEPADAAIYLNDMKLKNKMPIRLKNIAPQKYLIKITAPGYYDWIKEIEVKNKETAYIKEITLLKKNQPRQIMTDRAADLALSPNGRYLIFTVLKDDDKEIRLLNIPDQTFQTIDRLKNTDELQIIWSPNNSYLAISGARSPYSFLSVFNINQPEKNIDLAKKIKYPVTKYQWKEFGQTELFLGTDRKIMSYLPETNRLLSLSDNTYLDWQMENGRLWTLRASTGTDKFALWEDTLGFPALFAAWEKSAPADDNTDGDYQIMAAKDNTLLMKKKASSEALLAAGNKLHKLAADKLLISKYNDWWLIWTPWELWSYARGAEPTLLNRSGEQLQQVAALDKYNTLVLRWQNKTSVLFPYYYVGHDLEIGPTASLTADSVNRVLYYAGTGEKQGLWELRY